MQWLQDLNKSIVDNLDNVRHEVRRHFINKKKEYLEAKIGELETKIMMKYIRGLYRGINDFKKGGLVTGSHSILARWTNSFSQLCNVRGVSNVRQTEIHIAQPLVPQPSAFEVEMAFESLKGYKSPHNDQIPAELVMAGGRTICSEIYKLTVFGIRRNCFRNGRS